MLAHGRSSAALLLTAFYKVIEHGSASPGKQDRRESHGVVSSQPQQALKILQARVRTGPSV
jgi:hypothetical protein